MNKCKKKHHFLRRILGIMLVQVLFVAGVQAGVCPESGKTSMLSPQTAINLPDFQDMFQGMFSPNSSKEYGITRRGFSKMLGASIVAAALSPLLSFTEVFAGSPIMKLGDKVQLSNEEARKNVSILLSDGRIVDVYSDIADILSETEMPFEIIMALDLTETDTQNKVKSGAGAQGPMQVMKGTVDLYNDWLEEQSRKKKKSYEYKMAVKLIGGSKIVWKRINDPKYGRRVGAAIAFLKWHKLKTVFDKYGLLYMRSKKSWQFVEAGGVIRPYPYLTTAALCAAYNGPGERKVLDSIKKYGPLPKVSGKREDKKKLYYDFHQKVGWMDAGYNEETKIHFIRLWRYFNAVQEYKAENKKFWRNFAAREQEPERNISRRQMLAGIASLNIFGRIKKQDLPRKSGVGQSI